MTGRPEKAREEAQPVAVSERDIIEMTCFANNHGTLEDWAVWCRIRAALISPPTQPLAEGADAEKLRVAVEAFGAITDLSTALRQGGPDSMDLHDLSDNLNTAVDLAHEALAALQQEGRP